MDQWQDYLFKSQSEATYRNWAKRLRLFRFFRAFGGHANDGDSLDVAYKYDTPEELLGFFKFLGIVLIHHLEKPGQPEPGVSYPGDVFAKFPSIIKGTKWIEQPNHCQISGIDAFIWCEENRIKISVGKSYEITEEDVANAEKIETLLVASPLENIDPPADTKHYVCPKYYPSYFS